MFQHQHHIHNLLAPAAAILTVPPHPPFHSSHLKSAGRRGSESHIGRGGRRGGGRINSHLHTGRNRDPNSREEEAALLHGSCSSCSCAFSSRGAFPLKAKEGKAADRPLRLPAAGERPPIRPRPARLPPLPPPPQPARAACHPARRRLPHPSS